MMKSKKTVLTLFIACITMSAMGCGIFDLINAGNKLLAGQWGLLTSSEIRALSEAASQLAAQNGKTLTPLTQQQADALVTFISCAMITNNTDLMNVQNNPNSVDPQCLSNLATAFQGSNPNIDPNSVSPQDLQMIFGSLGGS